MYSFDGSVFCIVHGKFLRRVFIWQYPVTVDFLDWFALQADPNADVRGRMINAGILIIDKNGKDNVSLLFPIFENYLNKTVSSSYYFWRFTSWTLILLFIPCAVDGHFKHV